LRTRFEPAGLPELDDVFADEKGEFLIIDRGIASDMHSFVQERSVERTKFLTLTCTEEDIAAIHTGIKAYGQSALLCVRTTQDILEDGQVALLSDGLAIASIKRLLGVAPEREKLYLSWLEICQTTARLVDDWKAKDVLF
jgi:hypothetical protein